MTAEPVEAEVLPDIHERLLSRVAGWLDQPSCAFLRSIEDERPDFDLIGLLHSADFPAVRRKLHNLRSAHRREACGGSESVGRNADADRRRPLRRGALPIEIKMFGFLIR